MLNGLVMREENEWKARWEGFVDERKSRTLVQEDIDAWTRSSYDTKK